MRSSRIKKHINKVTIQGIVLSEPKLKRLSSGTLSCVFRIASFERFISRGVEMSHTNEFVLEALGTAAEKINKMIKKNNQYVFDGYLRSDKMSGNKKRLRIRIFHAEED